LFLALLVLFPGKELCYLWVGGWVGPSGQCGQVKSIASAGNQMAILYLYS